MKAKVLETTAKVVAPVVILTSLMCPIGCSAGAPGADGAATTNASAPARFDGETAYRGIFLGTGPVAAMLPELRDPAIAQAAQHMSKEQLATQLEGAAERMHATARESEVPARISAVAADLRSGKVTPEQLAQARSDFKAEAGDRIVARIKASDPTYFDRFGEAMRSGDRLRIQAALEEGGRVLLDAGALEGVLPGQISVEMRCIAVLVVVLLFWVAVANQPAGVSGSLQQQQVVDVIAERLAS